MESKLDCLIRRAKERHGLSTRNPYVSTHIELAEIAWERIYEFAKNSVTGAQKGLRTRKVRDNVIVRRMALYAHILTLSGLERYSESQDIPLSTTFLEKNFRIKGFELRAPGAGIRLTHKYKKGIRSNGYWPTDEVLGLIAVDGERMNFWHWAKAKGKDTSKLPFYPVKSLTIPELMISEKWHEETALISSLSPSKSPQVSSAWELIKSVGSIWSPWESSGGRKRGEGAEGAGEVGSRVATGAGGVLPSSVSICWTDKQSLEKLTEYDLAIKIDLDGATKYFENVYTPREQAEKGSALRAITSKSKKGYYLPKYLPFAFHGRYYEHGGALQGLKRDVRQVMLKTELESGRLYNYDIVKCQANALAILFDHFGLQSSAITDILSTLNDDCNKMGIPVELVKRAIYAGLWKGGLQYYKSKKDGKRTAVADAFLKHFGDEQVASAKLKLARNHLNRFRAELKRLEARLNAGEEQFTPLGAVVTEIEQSYIHVLACLCYAQGIAVVNLQHDGFMTTSAIPAALMEQAARLSGFYNAKLEQKDFCSLPAESRAKNEDYIKEEKQAVGGDWEPFTEVLAETRVTAPSAVIQSKNRKEEKTSDGPKQNDRRGLYAGGCPGNGLLGNGSVSRGLVRGRAHCRAPSS